MKEKSPTMKSSFETEADWNAGQAVDPCIEIHAAIVTDAEDTNVESTRLRMLTTGRPLFRRILHWLDGSAMMFCRIACRARTDQVVWWKGLSNCASR